MKARPSELGEQGFTLLEVLVAFIILSGALIAANQSISYSARAFSAATDARKAAVLAEAIFATVDVHSMKRGKSEGVENDYHWTLVVDGVNAGTSRRSLDVVRLRLEVNARSGRRVGVYETLRVNPGAPVAR
ncbi:type II secretion system protein [Rhizobium sp. PP-CC-3G-465]|uniref:type IV pilus modification PilV family protein n=1 Tax=Rhizobium sp. PP-CC-3G-465 TaxID=2135648 RepID=UPI00104AA766